MAGTTKPGKKRRGKQSSLASRYLASIDGCGGGLHQEAAHLTLTPNSSSLRSKSPHSKKSARTAGTDPTLEQSGSGSWTEGSPSRGAHSTSLDLTTPGSMQRDRDQVSNMDSPIQGNYSPQRTFSLFPATSPGAGRASRGNSRWDQSENSSLTSRRTTESTTTGSERYEELRFKDDFVGASIYSASLVEDGRAIEQIASQQQSLVHISLEKSLELFVGSCSASSAVGPSNAPTEIATNRAADFATREQHREILRAPSEASTAVATNRAVDMAMQRVRQLQNAKYESTLNEAKQAMHQRAEPKHPSRHSFGGDDPRSNLKQMGASSILSVSSNESSRIMSPAPPGVPAPRLSNGTDNEPVTGSLPPTAMINRLGNHMKKGEVRNEGLRLVGDSSVQSQSVSSSVGVETGDKHGIRASISNKGAWRSRQHAVEAVAEVEHETDSPERIVGSAISSPEDSGGSGGRSDLLLPELKESDEPRESLLAKQKSTAATRPFQKRTFTVKTAPSRRNLRDIDPCSSPPTIQRFLQDESVSSPDPIFCAHRSPNSSSRMSGSEESGSVWYGVAEASIRSMLSPDSNRDVTAEAASAKPIEKYFARQERKDTTHQSEFDECVEPLPQQAVASREELDTLLGVMTVERDHLTVSGVSSSNPQRESSMQETNASPSKVGRGTSNETLKEAKSRIDTFDLASKRVIGRWPPPLRDEGEQEEPEMEDSAKDQPPNGTVQARSTISVDVQVASTLSIPKGRSKSFSGNFRNGASSFLAAISTFENSAKKPQGFLSSSSEKSRFGISRIGQHLDRTQDVFDALSTDEASAGIDVQSLRSAFEPSVASKDTLEDNDDDDNASVKDLRDRFEGSTGEKATENGISRVRAMFEVKSAPPKRFEGASSSLKDAFAKFETKSAPPLSRLVRYNKDRAVDGKSSPETNAIPQVSASDPKTSTEATLSVAERVRTFGGNSKPAQPTPFGRKALASRPPPPPPPSRPPPPLLPQVIDCELGTHTTGGGQTTRKANLSFSENLNLFSGQKQKEEAAKVMATSAFRERISQFAIPSRKDEGNPIATTATEPSQLTKTPTMISFQRKKKPDPDGREMPTSGQNAELLRPVPVKGELTSVVAIKPVAVRPSGAISTRNSASMAPQAYSAGRVLQYWGQSANDQSRAAESQSKSLNIGASDRESHIAATSVSPPPTLGIAPRILSSPNEKNYAEDKRAPVAPSSRAPDYQKHAVAVDGQRHGNDEVSEAGSESEFSDGVTLDMSIAEVSGLTLPTALVSKAGDTSVSTVEEEQSVSTVEEEQNSGPTSKDVDPIEVEAKRSEASSSQPSEAAAPLIAKALRMVPMSDDLSANSFFANQAFLSKHWSKKSGWDSNSRDAEGPSGKVGYAPSIEEVDEEDEEEKKDEEPEQDSSSNTISGWDLRRVESSFPVKESSAGDLFDFDSGWQPFPPDPFGLNSPTVNDSMVSTGSGLSGVNVSMSSRSTTPPRTNTSRPVVRQGNALDGVSVSPRYTHATDSLPQRDALHHGTLASTLGLLPRSYAPHSHSIMQQDEYRRRTTTNLPVSPSAQYKTHTDQMAPARVLLPSHSHGSSMAHRDEIQKATPTWANFDMPPSQAYETTSAMCPPDELRPSVSENLAAMPSDDWAQSIPTSRSMPSHVTPLQESRPSPTGAGPMFGRTHPRSEDPTWKRRAGLMAAQARADRPPVTAPQLDQGRPQVLQQTPSPPQPHSLNASSQQSQSWNAFGRINRNMGKYGAQHAALMARLRSLKEARMRRASATYNRQSTRPYAPSDTFAPFMSQPSAYEPPDDEHSHSTMSSTKFGGNTFLASLEVD